LKPETDVIIKAVIHHTEVGSERYFEVRDPGRTSEVVARVALNTPRDVNDAVQSAHDAFQTWSKLDIKERGRLLLRAAAAAAEEIPMLTHLLVKENGTVLREMETDFPRGLRVFQHTLQKAEAFVAPQIVEDQESWMRIEKVPVGVIAVIVPWNSPVNLTMGKIAPALIMGNTVVIKPSPFAPAAVTLCLRKMASVLPPGVINVVQGQSEAGSALTSHPLVRGISFTGGIATGKAVMKNAAETVKNVGLELGGNDPAIVLDDVHVDEIIPRMAKGIFRRAGQVCYAIKRVYVPERIYDAFVHALCEYVDQFRVGHGLDERSTMGPVNNRHQYNWVHYLIAKAKESGASVRELGKKVDPAAWKEGYYILPTVVADIEPDEPLVRQEQFGPVIPVVKYRSIEQAIQWANGTEYGLASSVWSKDLERAVSTARRIEAGATFINDHSRESSGPDMPFGGMKQSGIGRERSEIGYAQYIEYHAIRFLKKYV
jgi:acyl-CoA reductase-like NAD-dependent aldehyde dehydrogenase